MGTHRRDAPLACCVLCVLLAALVSERAVKAVLTPLPAIVGSGSALLVEGAFLRSTAIERLWTRPLVRLGSAVTAVAVGIGTLALVGPAAVAALCWGLLTYFVLLGAVLVQGTNPLAAAL